MIDLRLEPLQQTLQFGPKEIQDQIAELIQHLQVQNSRLTAPRAYASDKVIAKNWYYGLIIDALEVYARATMLFTYARLGTNLASSEPTDYDMMSAAHICGFFCEDCWGELFKEINDEWGPDGRRLPTDEELSDEE